MRGILVWFGLSCALSAYAKSESSRVLVATSVATPPTIDAVLAPDEWPAAGKLERFYDPFTGELGTELTEGWITYDKDAIYVAYYCHDSDPSRIVADQIRQGAALDGDDQVVFRLDTFATGQGSNTSRFAVNPKGVTTETFAGGRAQKVEWRGEWQAAAKIVADGWIAEMRIPWKLLDLPGGAGPRSMTINFLRVEKKRNIRTMWSDRTPSERFDFEGTWQGVVPPATRASMRPQLLMYGLGEYDHQSHRFNGDAGLDAKLKISPQLTAVASINPDFKNIEQQVESIAFSRSERFLGDARPFFSEGVDYFKFSNQFAFGRLFYSRRIQDFDFGTKLVGRISPRTPMGALATIGHNNELNAVMSATHEFGPNAYGRVYALGHRDSRVRETVMGGTGYRRSGNFSGSADFVRLDGTARKANAYSYNLDFQDSSFYNSTRVYSIPRAFSPALSLITNRDVRGASNYLAYSRQWSGKKIRALSIESFANNLRRFDGRPYQDGFDVFGVLALQNDQRIVMSHESRRFEGVRDSVVGFGYSNGEQNRFRGLNVFSEIGRRNGSKYSRIEGGIRNRILRKLEVSLSATHESFNGRREQWIATAGWEFDANRAITARVVRVGDQVNSYVAYRSSGKKGNELFVILGDPNADKFRMRLVVKYVIPF